MGESRCGRYFAEVLQQYCLSPQRTWQPKCNGLRKSNSGRMQVKRTEQLVGAIGVVSHDLLKPRQERQSLILTVCFIQGST